ncbi:MAG: hypothetical protein IKO49_01125 [Bacilli bacterium]|nr:hypothetical protein [Clostridia bacterium]MBR2240139.1 hypothetical protein [Clostridia bacterium]MBR4617900.1 hypothetical protein [Bacilli bacterium]
MPPLGLEDMFKGCTEIKEINFPSLYPSTFTYTKYIQQRDPLDQAYEIVFNTMLNNISKNEVDEYKTLLKMYNNDYRLTVLAIEVDKTTK